MKRFKNAMCFTDNKYHFHYYILSLSNEKKMLKTLRLLKLRAVRMKDTYAQTYVLPEKKIVIFNFIKNMKDKDLVEACSHEAYHAARLILNALEVDITNPCDEKAAYLLGYIARSLYERLK